MTIILKYAVAVDVGPLVSAMANKFGLREVTIVGSVVASAFFVISSFSINIDMMLFTYGIMGGSSVLQTNASIQSLFIYLFIYL